MKYSIIIDSMDIPDGPVKINAGITVCEPRRAVWMRLLDLLDAARVAEEGKKNSICVYNALSDVDELRRLGVQVRVVKSDEPGPPKES